MSIATTAIPTPPATAPRPPAPGVAQPPAPSKEDFDFIRALVLKHSAIVLEPNKTYLAESRLGPVARKAGLRSIAELVQKLKAERPGDPLTTSVVEAMTTNETSFFRDVHPFEALRKAVLPAALARRAQEKALDIWCAAASTGQEPYTISMILQDEVPSISSWKIRYLATDISSEALNRARAGKFTQLEVNRGLPAGLLVKYFRKQGMDWVVSDALRSMIDFREMNLAATWPSMGPFDIVFIRNVLIYFDVETKKEILGKITRLLRPGGVVFLGGAETTLNLESKLERVQFDKTSYYRVAGA